MAASDTVKNILCLGTEINEILETLIVRGQKSGEVRKEVVPVLTVYVLSTSIDSLLALAETKGKFICAQNGMTEEEFLDYGEYYGAAEPPVRCGESHLSGLTEPLRSL